MPRSPLVALYLKAWMSDDEGAVAPGDVLEVGLRDFDADLSSASDGVTLRIAEFRNLRHGPALGIAARSYRVRIVGIREMTDRDRILFVIETDRNAEDYGAITS